MTNLPLLSQQPDGSWTANGQLLPPIYRVAFFDDGKKQLLVPRLLQNADGSWTDANGVPIPKLRYRK